MKVLVKFSDLKMVVLDNVKSFSMTDTVVEIEPISLDTSEKFIERLKELDESFLPWIDGNKVNIDIDKKVLFQLINDRNG